MPLCALVPLVPGLVSIAGLAVDPGADVVDPQVDGCRPDRWLYILIFRIYFYRSTNLLRLCPNELNKRCTYSPKRKYNLMGV